MFDQNKKLNTKKRGMITSVTVAKMLVSTISMTTVKFKLLVEIKWICTGYCDANHKNEFVQHNDFGCCLFGLKHIKSGNIVKAKLEIAAFEGQTVAVKEYAGIFVMRQMESYMGKGIKWDWGLDANPARSRKQIVILRKKIYG